MLDTDGHAPDASHMTITCGSLTRGRVTSMASVTQPQLARSKSGLMEPASDSIWIRVGTLRLNSETHHFLDTSEVFWRNHRADNPTLLYLTRYSMQSPHTR
jgi:hypothetical protein